MARPIDYCYSEDHAGGCLNVPGDPYLFPGWFHGYQGGNDPNGQNPANPANPNAQNGAVTSFPGGGNILASLLGDAGQGSALFSGNDGIWWLVLGGFALWAVLKK